MPISGDTDCLSQRLNHGVTPATTKTTGAIATVPMGQGGRSITPRQGTCECDRFRGHRPPHVTLGGGAAMDGAGTDPADCPGTAITRRGAATYRTASSRAGNTGHGRISVSPYTMYIEQKLQSW